MEMLTVYCLQMEVYSAAPVIFVVTFLVAYYFMKLMKFTTDHHLLLPPSLHRLPLIGSVHVLPQEKEWPSYFLQKSTELGSVFGLYFGSKYAVVLNNKKDIHDALVKHSSDFAGRPTYISNLIAFNVHVKGVVDHQYDTEFRRQHQLILSILRELGFGKDIMETRILSEVSSLVQRIRNKKGKPFWPDSLVSSSILSVILSIVVGHNFDDSKVEEYVKLIHAYFQETSEAADIDFVPMAKFLPSCRRAMLKAIETSKNLLNFVKECITTCSMDSFIQYYINRESSSLNDEQLLFVVRDLLLAGTETSASTLLWAVFLLANNRHVQTKMRHEMDSVVSQNEMPTLVHKSRLPYVEAVMFEIMRIKTIAPLALIHETKCDTTVGDFFIPAKTWVIPNLYAAHMDPVVWSDPLIFRPERFLDERGNIICKDQLIPFSIGRRSCLGEILARQEVFLFLCGIVHSFVIEPPEGQETVECGEKYCITLSPTPFNVRFIPR